MLATKLLKEVANKADRSDLIRLETRISMIAEDVSHVQTSGIMDLFDDREETESATLETAEDENHQMTYPTAASPVNGGNMTTAPTADNNWAAVRVFIKMQDKASTAALSRKIALNIQDIKRLTKSLGDLEEDVDTLRFV
jgi:hypothetical protein